MLDFSNLIVIFPFFAIGAVLGSFLNVLIDRLSTGRSFTTGRSYCEHCKKTLKTADLVPIFSYLLLLGRCRYCKKNIPFRIFFVELFCGLLFPFVYLYGLESALSLSAVPFLFLALWAYIGIFFADFEYGIIPDLLVGISILVIIPFLYIVGLPFANHFVSACGAFVFFLVLHLVTKGKGMGLGDVKLAFSLGLLLGFPLIVVALYVAFLTGAAIAIILVIWRKLRFFGGTVPFGPFLIFAAYFALFLGNQIALYITRSFF